MGQAVTTLLDGSGKGRQQGGGGSSEALMAAAGHEGGGGGARSRPPAHANFSFWVAVAFSTNYIMGCGFLGIPAAFVRSGVLLGPLLILLGGVVMNATKDFVLEAMARAEAMAKAAQVSARALRHGAAGHTTGRAGPRRGGSGAPGLIVPEAGDYLIDHVRKFEVTDLCLALVGPVARNVYVVILSLYMYGGLCAYASVWASSFSANVPLPFLNGGATCNVEQAGAVCTGPYLTWLALFAALAVPLACLDLTEQVGVQVVMFGARCLVVLLLTGTVGLGLATCDGVVFAEVPPGPLRPTRLVDPGGLAVVIPVSIFSFIFHHSIPGLSQPVGDKASLPRMFATTFAIITAFYASVGLLVALFFGEAVNNQCSLNWRQYVGCMPRPGNFTAAAASTDPMFAGVGVGVGDSAGGRALLPSLASALQGALGAAASATLGASSSSSSTARRGLLFSRGLGAPACSSSDTWAADGSCVDWEARPTYASVVSFIVLIFPALDVLSAFPLNAITLGNNLMSAVLGEAALTPPAPGDGEVEGEDGEDEGEEGAGDGRPRRGGGAKGATDGGAICRRRGTGTTHTASSSSRAARRVGTTGGGAGRYVPVSVAAPWYLQSARSHWLVKVGFRLLAAVPPVVVTAFVSDLGVILQLTGLVGVAIAFTIPALLLLWGRAKQRSVYGLMSHALLPPAGLATAGDVDAAVPLPSVRDGVAQEVVRDAAAGVAAEGSEEGAGSSGGAGAGKSSASSSSASSPHGSPSSPPLVTAALVVAPSRDGEALEPVAAAAKAVCPPITLSEATTPLPEGVEAVLRDTPYTSWAARGRGGEVVLGASLLVGAYVTVQTVLDVLVKK